MLLRILINFCIFSFCISTLQMVFPEVLQEQNNGQEILNDFLSVKTKIDSMKYGKQKKKNYEINELKNHHFQ